MINCFCSFFALPDPGLEDVEFDLEELDRIKIGESFSLVVRIKNRSNESRKINAALSVSSVFYNGVKARDIKKQKNDVQMKPKSS